MSTNTNSNKIRKIRWIMKTSNHSKDLTPMARMSDNGNDVSSGIEAMRKKSVRDHEIREKEMQKVIFETGKKHEEEEKEEKEQLSCWELRSRSKQGDQEKQKHRVTVPLSKSEIEEDFIKMIGSLPPRKPKKRLNVVQDQMDTLFPGLSLTNITTDLYKVPEHVRRCFAKKN